MIITRIEVWDFAAPMRDGTYVMSHVSQEHAYGRIIAVTTDTGLKGLGEMVFAPSISGRERLTQIASEPNYLPELIGKHTNMLMTKAEALRNDGKPARGAAFGLETAWHDLVARQRGEPVAALLGKPQCAAVEGYFSVSERSVDLITQRIAGPGQKTMVIQLKIGIGSLDEDAAHVSAALAAMRDDQVLLADANGGWTTEHACNIAARFDDPRVYWEEPCRDYDDNATVARAVEAPIMVDQCVADQATALKAIDQREVACLCIKPAFFGGLTPARDILQGCIRTNMAMRIDGPWCGDVASAAILHLALGAPPDLLLAGCDLRQPMIIDPDLRGVRYHDDGRIAPPPGPGLGLDSVMLGPPEAIYEQ